MDVENAGKLYCRLMVAVKARLRRLDQMREIPPGPLGVEDLYEVEAAMLSLRKVLELIVFSSLVANEQAMRAVTDGIEGLWRAKKMLEKIESLNPDFFPMPARIRYVNGTKCDYFTLLEDVAFRRSEFVDLYHACSKFLHVPNPFGKRVQPGLKRPLRDWVKQIRKLLKVHRVTLVGGEVGIVSMNGWGDAEVIFHHVGPAEKIDFEWNKATSP